jgi:hypothetical protein
MKTISLRISESDYEAFQRAAKLQGCSADYLIREAMKLYRQRYSLERPPLDSLPILDAGRPIDRLPDRSQLYEEMLTESEGWM